MAMQRQLWSVNGLSVELGVDRRRLSRLLEDATPAGVGPNGPTYFLADAVRRLTIGRGFAYTDADRLDHAAGQFVTHLTGDDEAEARLAPLAGALAKATTPARCERLLREYLAARCWAWLATPDTPPPPRWPKLDDATLARTLGALVEGFPLADALAIARGEDPDAGAA